jgi:hypothetical protein
MSGAPSPIPCRSPRSCTRRPSADPATPPGRTDYERFDEAHALAEAGEHAPFSFDLYDNLIRLNLTFHTADVFARPGLDEASAWIARFVDSADRFDNLLIEKVGCAPAPETRLAFLTEPAR